MARWARAGGAIVGAASRLKSSGRLRRGTCLPDAPGPASFGAFVDLSGQDLGEMGQVGLVLADGDLG